MNGLRRVAAAALAAAAAGCGDGGLPLAPVRGAVTLDGRPLAGKTVKFIPEAGTAGVGAGANTGADGSYRLLAVRPGATRNTYGVVPGRYKVVVTEPIIPIDAPAPPADGRALAPPVRPPKRTVPARYGDPAATPLTADVPPDGGAFDFALTTRP